MNDNLINPIEFVEFAEAQKFCQRNVCALCLGELTPSQGRERTWQITCANDGPAYQHTVARRGQAEEVEQQRRGAERDLRPEKPKRSPEEILKLLGF